MPEEMARMQRNILSGDADANLDFHSVNEVTAPPKVFNDWVENNQDRIVKAKALLYFLRDNGKIVEGKWAYQKTTTDAVRTVADVEASELDKGAMNLLKSVEVKDDWDGVPSLGRKDTEDILSMVLNDGERIKEVKVISLDDEFARYDRKRKRIGISDHTIFGAEPKNGINNAETLIKRLSLLPSEFEKMLTDDL